MRKQIKVLTKIKPRSYAGKFIKASHKKLKPKRHK